MIIALPCEELRTRASGIRPGWRRASVDNEHAKAYDGRGTRST